MDDWNLYAEREPFGVDDQQFGLLRALVAAAAGAKEIDPANFTIAGMLRRAREFMAGDSADAGPASVAAFERAISRRPK